MAELKENLIKFGWLNKEEMLAAISDGKLNSHDICYCKDTREQFIINTSLEPIPIRSRVRLYGSAESAIENIRTSKETYAGEIISVRDGEKFIAYVVNKFQNGEFYISPVYSDSMINYDGLQNTPIKNIEGTVSNPIILTDLDNGYYKIKGHFITPDGKEITSFVGNFIIIEDNVDELTLKKTKLIKRINSSSIVDYYVEDDSTYKVQKYATEQYIKDQGYATQDDVETALTAFKLTMEGYVREYVATTCTILIKHIVNEELDSRYSSEEDIEKLFKN